MDLVEFQEKYPKIYQAVFDEGVAAGIEEGLKDGEAAGIEKGKAEGIKEGITAERKRIQDVEAQLLPGHEKLIAELKFDGKTTGPEAAVRVLDAENMLRLTIKSQLISDSPEAAAHVAAPEIETTKITDKSRPIKERAQASWDNDASLRSEFLDDFEAYLAYLKADEGGRVKVISGKK